MTDDDRRDLERRLRTAALTNATRQPPEPASVEEPVDDQPEERGRTLEQRTLWVDQQIRSAMARGEFDDLPGAGKPIRGLETSYDPDWWVKNLIERERITGVLPPALALRKEDAALDEQLDRETAESEVRRTVEDFNRRVVEARRQLNGGPPVVTPTRDVDGEVAAWRERREARVARHREARAAAEAAAAAAPVTRRTRWWRRRR
ncbi:MAG: DnaJ family domain-containing protein [Nocardioidaceae bacterium]